MAGDEGEALQILVGARETLVGFAKIGLHLFQVRDVGYVGHPAVHRAVAVECGDVDGIHPAHSEIGVPDLRLVCGAFAGKDPVHVRANRGIAFRTEHIGHVPSGDLLGRPHEPLRIPPADPNVLPVAVVARDRGGHGIGDQLQLLARGMGVVQGRFPLDQRLPELPVAGLDSREHLVEGVHQNA